MNPLRVICGPTPADPWSGMGSRKGPILGVPFRPLFRVVIADALFKRVTSHPYILPSGWIWG